MKPPAHEQIRTATEGPPLNGQRKKTTGERRWGRGGGRGGGGGGGALNSFTLEKRHP